MLSLLDGDAVVDTVATAAIPKLLPVLGDHPEPALELTRAVAVAGESGVVPGVVPGAGVARGRELPVIRVMISRLLKADLYLLAPPFGAAANDLEGRRELARRVLGVAWSATRSPYRVR